MFELAETYNEMMDLKLTRANRQADTQSLDNHTIKKINHLCSSSAKWVLVCMNDSCVSVYLNLFNLNFFDIISSLVQILPDVSRLSALSRGEVSRAPGGGGPQTCSGSTFQSGPPPQPADLPFNHCSCGQPQQVTGKLQVWSYNCFVHGETSVLQIERYGLSRIKSSQLFFLFR